MKKVVITLTFAFIAMLTLSCREKETKTVVKEVETETVQPVEEREGILERTAKEVDKEVNEEINEEIDKIGNDD